MLIANKSAQPGDVIAVGDIHGHLEHLNMFLESVRDTQTTVILLGDLIDRGPDDIGVLERVEELLENPGAWGLEAAYALRGNHEHMFLEACNGIRMGLWADNGGRTEHLNRMRVHEDWVRALPIFMTIGETMFIHAGPFTGKNPAEAIKAGYTEAILWMREPFLTLGPQFHRWNSNLKEVIFGHTPLGPEPYRIPNGICIDSGVCFTGVLTSYNVTRKTFQRFTVEKEKV